MDILDGHRMLLQLLEEAHQHALLLRLESAILEHICPGGGHLPVLAIPPHIAAGQCCISYCDFAGMSARYSH